MSKPGDTDLDPAETVRRFIADMHAWEMQAAADDHATQPRGSDAFWDRTRSAQAEVFARWCTAKQRPYGRRGAFSQPPECQPAHERILETCLESPRRAAVYTQEGTGFKRKLRYVLLRQAGRWRIDNKKREDHAGKWVHRGL